MAKLDASGVNSASEVKQDDKNHPLAGYYLVIVNQLKWNATAGKEKTGAEIIESQVVGGTTPGQEGCDVVIFLYRDKDGEMGAKHLRYALATELIKPKQVASDIDTEFFRPSVGRFFVVRMEDWEKDGKKGVGVGSFGYDLWAINDPEVRDIVTKMDGQVPQILQQRFGGQAQQGQQGQPAQQTATRQTQPAPIEQPVGAVNGATATAGTGGWDV